MFLFPDLWWYKNFNCAEYLITTPLCKPTEFYQNVADRTNRTIFARITPKISHGYFQLTNQSQYDPQENALS